MQHETVIVLDFGGQYNQLIARRVRENNVYCEIYSYKTDLSVIKAKNPKGIIFTGGPNSVYLEDSPTIDPEIFSWGVPVLGICYGSQLMMHLLGGRVCRAPEREYGKTEVFVDNSSKMFTDVQPSTVCWMSHNDYIEQAAPGFKITAHTVNCPVAAAENEERGCTPSSSTPRCSTPLRARRCCTTSCTMSAAAPATGRWTPSWKTTSRLCGSASAAARCSAPCPAASIPPCWLPCWPRPSASS